MTNYQYFLSFAGDDNVSVLDVNPLQDFARELEKIVQGRTTGRGEDDQIGFMHAHGSRAGNDWPKDILHALQNSQVLVALLSRKYFDSLSCRREFQFFLERSRLSEHAGAGMGAYRVIPVFFEDAEFLKEQHPSSHAYLKQITDLMDYRLEVSALGIDKRPEYPKRGIATMCHYYKKEFKYITHAVAERIDYFVNVVNARHPLKQIQNPSPFRQFPAFCDPPRVTLPGVHRWNVGPKGANVVYVIGTKAQMQLSTHAETCYGDTSQAWRPFGDEVDICSATQEGLGMTDCSEQNHCDFPDDLIEHLQHASTSNSPVLLTIDPESISRLPETVQKQIKDYDRQSFWNVGLIAINPDGQTNDALNGAFPFKFQLSQPPHHLWKVSSKREEYMRAVAQVLNGLRHQIQQYGSPIEKRPAHAVPGLSGPTGGRQ